MGQRLLSHLGFRMSSVLLEQGNWTRKTTFQLLGKKKKGKIKLKNLVLYVIQSLCLVKYY